MATPLMTLLTPTGDRPQTFALCERWIRQQTFTEFRWIVIDDGDKPTSYTLKQDYIRRIPAPGEQGHSLPRNLLAALPHVTTDHVAIIEDDDYYAPNYLAVMRQRLQRAQLVGEKHARYWDVRNATYQDGLHQWHASLSRTALHCDLLPLVAAGCRYGTPWIDLWLWRRYRGSLECGDNLHVTMRGLPGRPSISHSYGWQPDGEFRMLRRWLGNDAEPYIEFACAHAAASVGTSET